jgi:hypothetical protein
MYYLSLRPSHHLFKTGFERLARFLRLLTLALQYIYLNVSWLGGFELFTLSSMCKRAFQESWLGNLLHKSREFQQLELGKTKLLS